MSMYDPILKKAKQAYVTFCSDTQSYLMQYIRHLVHRQLSPGSILAVISALSNFFSFLPCHKQGNIRLLSKEDVFDFIQHLNDRGLAPCTVNNYLSHLKMFFFYMMDDDLISSNPVLNRYYVKESQRLPRPMAPEDIAKFLNYLKGKPYEVIFLLMLYSGLRVSEACQIKWGDINWETQQIIIRNGKGAVDRVIYFDNRVKRHLQEQEKRRCFGNSYCFPSSMKGEGENLGSCTIRWRMKRYLKACSLDRKGYSPHSLRHSFATNMLNAGVSLWVLRDLMGHKNIDQTLEYAKLSNETIRSAFFEAMEKIEPQQPSHFQRRYYGLS